MTAVYARQSVDKKDSISIETQIEFCKKAAEGEVKIYIDKGYSGKNTKRPAYLEMMEDIRAARISKIIIYKLDRISRSIVDFANIYDILEKHRTQFVSVTENFDTTTPMGRAMLSITMVFAQLERETIQQRVTDNYYARAKKGFFMGGPPPYGLKKEQTFLNGKKTSVLVPCDSCSTYLEKIFDQYGRQEMTLGQISSFLNKSKVVSANQRAWDSGKVSRILRNPIYVKADADVYLYFAERGCEITSDVSLFCGEYGCFLYGKRSDGKRKYTSVEGQFLSLACSAGIIKSSLWLACQERLDENSQIKNSGRGKHSFLSGLTKCGYCGYAMTVITSRDYKYFVCRGRTNYKNCHGHGVTLYVEEAQKAVQNEMLKKIKELEGMRVQFQSTENSAEKNPLKLQLIETKKKLSNLIKMVEEGNDITKKYLNESIKRLDKEKNRILDSLTKHRSKIADLSTCNERFDDLSLEKKKALCRLLIEKIIFKEELITICWRF